MSDSASVEVMCFVAKSHILFEDLLHCWRQNVSKSAAEHVDRRVTLQKNKDISNCGQ